MSDTVQITTLANGLRVVSEDMPRLETASLGVWVDVGTRYEPAEVNGVAHLLEHMAFKGTEPPLGPGDRRGDRARRRQPQRLHLARAHRLLRPHPGRRRAARRRHPGRHPAALDLRSGRAGEGAPRRPAGDRPGQGHAGRPRVRPASRRRPTPTSRWAARSWGRRRSWRRCRARRWSTTWRAHYGP